MPDTAIIFVDMQYDFTRSGGACYAPRSSVRFVRDHLIPYIKRADVPALQIVSDYRQPRPGDPRDCCRPGEWGYTSEIPKEILSGPDLIKCMNSPIWTREGTGEASKHPGLPYQDPASFDVWIDENLSLKGIGTVILSGLTLDACVLCAAQELSFRGFTVMTLEEGTDARSGRIEDRTRMLRTPPFSHWSGTISFAGLRELFD